VPTAAVGASVRSALSLGAPGLVLILDGGEGQLRGDLVAIADLEAFAHVSDMMPGATDITVTTRGSELSGASWGSQRRLERDRGHASRIQFVLREWSGCLSHVAHRNIPIRPPDSHAD